MGASPMPMPTEARPYALCPMPYEHLMLLRKAILLFDSVLTPARAISPEVDPRAGFSRIRRPCAFLGATGELLISGRIIYYL